jgi:hypothetical protein
MQNDTARSTRAERPEPAGRTQHAEPAEHPEHARPHREDRSLDVRIGHHELVLSQRYEAASIANDVLIGIWFIVGSIFFFFASMMTAGTVLFLIGSLQMTIRPVIRLARRFHLQRVSGRSVPHAMDF